MVHDSMEFRVKEDKSLKNLLAVVVVPNESCNDISFASISEPEQSLPFDQQKIVLVEFKNEDYRKQYLNYKLLLKFGKNAFCNAKYEVSTKIIG